MKKPLHITARPPYYLSDFTVVTSSLVKFCLLYLRRYDYDYVYNRFFSIICDLPGLETY